MAAPLVPCRLATAVAWAPTFIVAPNPRTCMIVIPTRCTAVAWNVTPAIEWLATLSVSAWLVGSLYTQLTVMVP